MLRVIADNKIPFLKGVLEPFCEVLYLPGKSIDNSVVKEADALLIRTRTKCDERLLKGSKVKFIGTATIGYDHIDTAYCNKNTIFWTNAPGCNSSSVQQYIAAALHKIAYKSDRPLNSLKLGIIGVGNVGSKVEKYARLMGMQVLLNDPPRAEREGSELFTSLDDLLQESDIVTVHTPLNRGGEHNTFHLFAEKQFRLIKSGAWLINSSRGEVVNTDSIKTALSSGKLSGAMIDVWENEPDIDLDLLGEVVIGTPHIAGYSTDGKANGTAMVIKSLSKYFSLPLSEWYPLDVPGAENPLITIDAIGKSTEEVVREAVSNTYQIDLDDELLRKCPSDFEKQRGDYRLRREFSAFTVGLAGGRPDLINTLKEIGFRVK